MLNSKFLVDGNGEITIGAIASILCAATAADGEQGLAMRVRRDSETFAQLLVRRNRANAIAADDEAFIDAIKNV